MTLQPGETLGRYQILEPLGTGGMATVYKAYEPSLDRTVALKVIRPGLSAEVDFVARFRREAQAVAKLTHPNIVQVHAFDETEGRLFLAMRYLDGGTLKDRIEVLGPEERLDRSEVASIVTQVAAALGYAHQRGIVHRDIKPSNIMLTEDGQVVVTDFGIAKIVAAEQLTQTGVGIGTPEYMAPEQGAGGKVDQRADIYALGAVAYELLTGRVPFTADTPFAIVAAHMRDPLPLPSGIDPTIGPATERALLKALAKDPAQRFASAPEFAATLREGIAQQIPASAMPPIIPRSDVTATPPSTRRFSVTLPGLPRSRPAFAGIGAAVLAIIAATSALVSGAFGTGPASSTLATAAPAAVTVVPTAAPTSPLPRSTVSAFTPSPETPKTAAPTPKFAVPAKGELIWQAPLDGSGRGDLRFWNMCGKDATRKAAYSFSPGAIQFDLAGLGTRSCGAFSVVLPDPTHLVREIDLSFSPGTDMLFTLCTYNTPAPGFCGILIDVAASTSRLIVADQTSYPVSAAPIAGLQTGRTLTVALVLNGSRYALYLDQTLVAQGTGTAGEPAADSIQVSGTTGSVRILGARFYSLP